MTLSVDEIESQFFRFLAGELPIKEFEQWIYSTPQIEDYLGESAYLEFISFHFQQPAANLELTKLVFKYVSPGKFYNWQVKRLLESLLNGTLDSVDIFEKLYDMYIKGYYFLQNIGIQYVLGIDDIPRLAEQHLWDESEFFRHRKILDNYLTTSMRDEIVLLLGALESGEIKILDAKSILLRPN